MDTIIFTNILFVSLTIFLIFITVGFTILLIYIILFVKSLRYFLNVIGRESDKISDDIEKVREKIKNGETMLLSFIEYIVSSFRNYRKKPKK